MNVEGEMARTIYDPFFPYNKLDHGCNPVDVGDYRGFSAPSHYTAKLLTRDVMA